MKAADGTWRGISIDLWQRAATSLHLSYRFAEASTVDDLIKGTTEGRFDAAIAAITVTASRDRNVDFGQPYFSTGLGVAVPANSASPWESIRRIFFSFGFVQAVAALVGMSVLVELLIWLFERRHNEHFGGGTKGLGSGVWWSSTTMTQKGSAQRAPTTLPGRLLAIAWMVASVIAIAVFTAGITSSLTKREIQGLVQNESDLTSVRVGVVAASAAQDYLARQRIRTYGYANANEGLRALQAGRIDALVYDRPLLKWLVLREFPSSLRVLDATFAEQNYAIAFPKGSALREKVDSVVLDNIESEWWGETLLRYLGGR